EVVLVLCCLGWILALSASSSFPCGGVIPFRLVLCHWLWFVSLRLVVEDQQDLHDSWRSNQARSLRGVFIKVAPHKALFNLELESRRLVACAKSTQAKIHEQLLSSSRLEDGKKVPSIISRIEENTTVEGDATRRHVHQGRRVIIIIATDIPAVTP
ncbi:hypothetical protein Taro_045680, partial [Colocasia esculenta]|nr:hypothetical protein [Colocasia esculenta]